MTKLPRLPDQGSLMSSTPAALCSALLLLIFDLLYYCLRPSSSLFSLPYLFPVPTLSLPPSTSSCPGLHLLLFHISICCISAIQLPCDCISWSGIPSLLAHSDDCFLLGRFCLG